MRDVFVRDLGTTHYPEIFLKMRDYSRARDMNSNDEIWITEHNAVFTLGQAAKKEHLIAPGSIPVYQSDRGGQVTYHGPGQLTVYFLVDIKRLSISVRQLVDRIEWARGGVQPVCGYIGVDWCQRDDGVEMAVDIPANCRAEVIVPGSAAGSICVDGAVVWEKGGYVPGMAGMAGAVEREGAVALDAGPGFYRICSSGHPRDALG